MTEISILVGLFSTIILIAAASIYSGKHIGSANDFASSGGSNGTALVSGAIMGTLVGGSSTIGTAQLAYYYGMSAWWFTLGAGIGCLFLALLFSDRMRRTGKITLMQIITEEYGERCGMVASVLSSVGTFINILSQLISASAIWAVVFPGMTFPMALALSSLLMILYVVFGGVKSAGLVGVIKCILLYVSVIWGGVIVLRLCGGVDPFIGLVSELKSSDPNSVNFFSVFARGFGKDFGAALSLIFGVITTQSYAQAIFSAKSDKVAKSGALASTVLIPIIGIGGILIGLYMRSNFPDIPAKSAMTQFVVDFMPPVVAGIVLGSLLIAVVGTGAGLALGVSTVICKNIVSRIKKLKQLSTSLLFIRSCIVVIFIIACVLCMCPIGDIILNFAFMSMGLRGATTFAPLCGSLFFKNRIKPVYAIISVIVGPLCVLLGKSILPASIDPLIPATILACAIMAIGLLDKRGSAKSE